MASPLRQKRSNAVVWALMGLLVLGIGGFGITSFTGNVQAIGAVGEREVDVNDYARTLQGEMRALSAELGEPVSFAQAQALGIDSAVQAQLFAGAALDHEADRLGVSVGDDELRKRLLAIQAFQGLDGAFDRDTYTLWLQQQGLSEGEFEEKLRDESARTILQGAVVGGLAAPASYVDTMAAWIGETRDFTLVRLLPSDLAEPVPEPAEDEIKAHYDANPEPFTAPETRNLTAVWLSPEALADTVEVDEAALKEAYEARRGEFVVPERRLVERLVFATEDEAAEAKARIDAGGTDFATVVAERGLSLADIDLGEQSKEDLGPAGDAVFALEEPGIVGPLPSDLGPALYSMNAILSAQETTFEEARDELDGEARLDRARRMIADQTTAIEDLLASGASLEDVAKEAGMELLTVAFNEAAEGGLAGYSAFREKAAEVAADDFPELLALDDGGVFALRLDEIVPPTLKPLDDVRDEVAAAWRAAETQTRLAALAAELKAQLDNGATLQSLGLVTTHYDRLARGGFVADAPGDVAAAVFRTEAGKNAVVQTKDSVHLLTVDTVHAVDMAEAEIAALAEQIRTRAVQGIAQDIFEAYTQGVQTEAGITVDSAALNAVNAQIQ